MLGSAMEIGETEMRVRRWRLERQRWAMETRDERQRRESQIKYYYFFTILATVQFSNADDFGT